MVKISVRKIMERAIGPQSETIEKDLMNYSSVTKKQYFRMHKAIGFVQLMREVLRGLSFFYG
ncbi:hypothetical protein COE15_05245 [Bacillus cereus]|nr:hypothetical protein CN288_05270 [Bacillus sp. AFS023182]PGY03722.1 hypothetical protein COE15_05245 [Bacillus cereus]